MLPFTKLVSYISSFEYGDHHHNVQMNGLSIGYNQEWKGEYECEILGNQLKLCKTVLLHIVIKNDSVVVYANYIELGVYFKRDGSKLIKDIVHSWFNIKD